MKLKKNTIMFKKHILFERIISIYKATENRFKKQAVLFVYANSFAIDKNHFFQNSGNTIIIK